MKKNSHVDDILNGIREILTGFRRPKVWKKTRVRETLNCIFKENYPELDSHQDAITGLSMLLEMCFEQHVANDRPR